jgi:hypothetical protein
MNHKNLKIMYNCKPKKRKTSLSKTLTINENTLPVILTNRKLTKKRP